MRIAGLDGTGRCVSRALGRAMTGACLALLPVLGARVEAGPRMQDALADTDQRWQPWLGCWELSHEVTDDPDAPNPAAPLPPRAMGAPSTAVRVCVTQDSATPGVRMSTQVQGKPMLEERLVADGSEQAVDDKTCRGSRRTEWSRNGLRLFGRAEITCAGEPPQSVSHLATIVGGTWVDVQGITREARQGLRVRRYRRVGNESSDSGQSVLPGVGSFGIEDVKEASAKVTPLVLQAALVETAARFRLTGKTMMELDRAGVGDEVTDLMVALTYRDRFTVARESASGSGDPFHAGWPDATVDDDDAYLWGYAPFAYSYWRFNDYWSSPTVVIVDDREAGGSGGHPASGGRVVNGRGYTRIERAESGSAGRADSAGSGSTSSTATSSGDSGGVSSQGYSSGGSSGDSDRTAQPRPPR